MTRLTTAQQQAYDQLRQRFPSQAEQILQRMTNQPGRSVTHTAHAGGGASRRPVELNPPRSADHVYAPGEEAQTLRQGRR